MREGARKNEKGRKEGVCSLVQVGLKRVFGVQLKHATFVRLKEFDCCVAARSRLLLSSFCTFFPFEIIIFKIHIRHLFQRFFC